MKIKLMKTLTLLLLLIANITFAQVKNAEAVPDINFGPILNAPVKTAKLSRLKGKIVLIDFWATWCGSCLEAMPYLIQLQQKYPSQLQVITVTDETARRTGQYLVSRPSNLWFAVDTARLIDKLFPHRFIPHTVLISPDGKLIACTNPGAVTALVIDSLLHKMDVHLPAKKDNLLSREELIKQYFYAADTVKSRFMMLPEIMGGPGFSTTHLADSVFAGRRLTCLNLPLTTLYMIAYGGFPYGRVIDNTGAGGDKAPKYCLDLIVKNKADLLPALREELAKRFDLQARIQPELKEVNVLRIADTAQFKTIRRNQSGRRTYGSSHGAIDQESITMTDFADFLESFGIGKLVVDETSNHEKLDVQFSFQPENPQSLKDILTGMGLSLTKQQREVNMLLLYKQTL
jgi:thiol-disulfide isomerase/thioredoxin